MKNQSFHRRKIRIQEEPKLDFDQLKARTINALNKLGQQKFSTEPGGYALENWVRGINVLLDEFEEKAGAARLSPQYLAGRRDLNARLSRPVAVSEIDEEIAGLREGISGIERKVDTERAMLASKISELQAKETTLSGELERERRRVAAATAAKSTNSFMSRLFGRRAPKEDPGNRIGELESDLAALTSEILDLQRQVKMIDRRSAESQLAEEWGRLDSMQTKLSELEAERLERAHLVRERAEVTGSMVDAISRMT